MELEYHHNDIVWETVWGLNNAIDIGEWARGGGGRLERFCRCVDSAVPMNTMFIHCTCPVR